MSNVVDATSQEEQIHGLFGYELVRLLRREHPEWFDDALEVVGYRPEFRPPAEALAPVAWFDEETLAGKHVDFFHKRPTAYAKKARAFSTGELL